jgi:quinol-cytochrome oxidoreductase complex cytochrome b subunit
VYFSFDVTERVVDRSSVDPGASSSEQKMDEPKSGWLHDTMHKILANITIQVLNLQQLNNFSFLAYS